MPNAASLRSSSSDAGLLAVVAELEERLHQLIVGLLRPLGHRGFELRITLRGIEDRQHLRIARFLARQRRRIRKHDRQSVEERLRRNPHDFLLAGRRVRQFLDRVPVDALHRAVVLGSGYILICLSSGWIAPIRRPCRP